MVSIGNPRSFAEEKPLTNADSTSIRKTVVTVPGDSFATSKTRSNALFQVAKRYSNVLNSSDLLTKISSDTLEE